MLFNGPAPERINGRLAMVALSLVARREAEGAGTVLQQLTAPDWAVAAGMALLVYASLVPILRGCKDEDCGPFSVRAEKANGRAAMLGFAVLLGLERWSGVPFF